MVKSMYSGVTGMKAHQTKMDVIGNNISNVNTYGFKSSRATFRDVYYQSLRSAGAPSGGKGGTNPSEVGYGATVSSVDLQMTGSSVTNTGNPMDVAIDGDGFFQVQDADGNIFYTRAGMLDIDSEGNVVDMNGYLVLGASGNPVGQAASSNSINVLQEMGTVPATAAHATDTINKNKFDFKATNATREGNVSLLISSSENLPIGQKAEAIVGTSSIKILLNAKEKFTSLAQVQDAINAAITKANDGKAHPAGDFNITMDPDTMFSMGEVAAKGGLTGAEVAGNNFGYVQGSIPVSGTTGATNTPVTEVMCGVTIKEVGDKFSGVGAPTFTLTQTDAFTAAGGGKFNFEIKIGAKTYSFPVEADQMKTAGSVKLPMTGGDPDDYITITYPSLSSMLGKLPVEDPTKTYAELGYTDASILPPGYTLNMKGPKITAGKLNGLPPALTLNELAVASHPSYDLGLGSHAIKLKDGTEGGALELKDLSGISIGADGVIRANHSILGEKEVGRIDLATFNNPAALIQSGNSYYVGSANSGPGTPAFAGTGGAGGMKTSSLELSNVDLSQEFADMITTQRGFQANSRLITVSDTMLEELVNLKR